MSEKKKKRNEFYNKERKERYLSNEDITENSKIMLETLFSRSADLERYYDVDVGDFSLAQIQSLFVLGRWYSASTFSVYKVFLKKYISWCIEEGYTNNINNAALLNQKTVGKEMIRRELFPDTESFLNAMDLVFGTYEEKEQRNMNRTFLYLLWLGFTKEEVVTIQRNQVFEDSVVGDAWRADNIDPRMAKVLQDVRNMEECVVEGSTGVALTKKLKQTPYLLRTMNNSRASKASVITESTVSSWHMWVDRQQNRRREDDIAYIRKNFAPTKVFACGCYVRLRKWEQEGNIKATLKNFPDWCPVVRKDSETASKNVLGMFLKSYHEWESAFWDDASL